MGNQVHALYNANAFIKYSPGSEEVVCASPSLLASFPSLPSADMLDVVAHEAPLLLRKQMADLFPSQKLSEGPLTVVTLAVSYRGFSSQAGATHRGWRNELKM